MRIRWAYLPIALLCLSCAVFAYQIPRPDPAPEDPAAKERAEKQKQLMEINKIQDDVKKRELLEKFIAENAGSPVSAGARDSLMWTLSRVDPAKAIEMVDQILSQPEDPKIPYLRRNSYGAKFIALQKMKDTEGLKAFGQKILDEEKNPWVLKTAAQFDKDHSLPLLEKALTEAEKITEKNAFPTVGDLKISYARELGQRNQTEKALEMLTSGVEWTQKRIAELEALPEKDPLRRHAEFMRQSIPSHHQTMAGFLADIKKYPEAMDFLKKAEASLGEAAQERRSSLEGTRARIYEGMGEVDKALASHALSFAYRMDPKTREKIKTLAEKSGKTADDYIAAARRTRAERAASFKPFELKTIEQEAKSFQDLKGKVTLVNFFFPT